MGQQHKTSNATNISGEIKSQRVEKAFLPLLDAFFPPPFPLLSLSLCACLSNGFDLWVVGETTLTSVEATVRHFYSGLGFLHCKISTWGRREGKQNSNFTIAVGDGGLYCGPPLFACHKMSAGPWSFLFFWLFSFFHLLFCHLFSTFQA